MIRGVSFWLASGMFVAVLSGCKRVDESTKDDTFLRYRITMEVETPKGLRSGSSIYELEYIPAEYSFLDRLFALGESRGRIKVRGEAAFVDLPNGKSVFLLMKDRARTPSYAFPDYLAATNVLDGIGLRRDKPKAEIWPELPVKTMKDYLDAKKRLPNQKLIQRPLQPFLVTFENMADPTSVKKVEADDLAETFGDGYALKSITVEITDRSVTTEIGKKLEWLSTNTQSSLKVDHGPKDFSIAATIRHGDFRKGVSK